MSDVIAYQFGPFGPRFEGLFDSSMAFRPFVGFDVLSTVLKSDAGHIVVLFRE